MIETLQIKKMSHLEQLQTIEALWRELSANVNLVQSPS